MSLFKCKFKVKLIISRSLCNCFRTYLGNKHQTTGSDRYAWSLHSLTMVFPQWWNPQSTIFAFLKNLFYLLLMKLNLMMLFSVTLKHFAVNGRVNLQPFIPVLSTHYDRMYYLSATDCATNIKKESISVDGDHIS